MSGVQVHPNDITWVAEPVREALANPKVRLAFPVKRPQGDDIDVMNAAVEPLDRAMVDKLIDITRSSNYMARRLMVATAIGEVLTGGGDEHGTVIHGGDRAPPRAVSKWRAACWESRRRGMEVLRLIRKRQGGGA